MGINNTLRPYILRSFIALTSCAIILFIYYSVASSGSDDVDEDGVAVSGVCIQMKDDLVKLFFMNEISVSLSLDPSTLVSIIIDDDEKIKMLQHRSLVRSPNVHNASVS